MASYIPAYRGAAARPDKFCHGFGIFQLDLQFFKTEPDYFLERRYADFDAALARCVGELQVGAEAHRLAGQDLAQRCRDGRGRDRLQHRALRPGEGLEARLLRRHASTTARTTSPTCSSPRASSFPAAEAAPSRDARALPAQRRRKRKAAKAASRSDQRGAKPAKTTPRRRRRRDGEGGGQAAQGGDERQEGEGDQDGETSPRREGAPRQDREARQGVEGRREAR